NTIEPVVSRTADFLSAAYSVAKAMDKLANGSEAYSVPSECSENWPNPPIQDNVAVCAFGHDYAYSSEGELQEPTAPGSHYTGTQTDIHTTRWVRMTITRTSDTSYVFKTVPVVRTLVTHTVCDGTYCEYTEDPLEAPRPAADLPELSATFASDASFDIAPASVSGMYYVRVDGGSLSADLQVIPSGDWDEETHTGSIRASGRLFGGEG